MRQKTINIYKFRELSESVKKKVIELNSDINTNFDWWDSTYEDITTLAKLMGIDISKIYFSGFSSQGDGACFEGTYHYEPNAVQAIKDFAPIDSVINMAIRFEAIQSQSHIPYNLTASIKHHGRYYHSGCTSIDVEGDNNPNEVEELQQALRDFMNYIYKRLNEEYDDLTSDQAIIEAIECNEYEFTENGTIHN